MSKLFRAQAGSIWFLPGSYGFYSSEIGSYKLKNGFLTVHKHAHALFQDRFKDVQVCSRWFSTLYILSPNVHTPSWTVVLYTEVLIDYHTVC